MSCHSSSSQAFRAIRYCGRDGLPTSSFQMVPAANRRRIAASNALLFINPTNPPSVEEARSLQAAAAALGQRLLILQASTLGQLQDAFATMKQQQVRALIVSSDPFFFSERVKLVVLMARDALPTIFADREQADAGGLMSYGASRSDAYRQVGNYVGRS